MVVQHKPRIVIYGVGQFGQYVTRFATQKGWPIVAAYNRAGSKVGQDIGRLAGLDRDLGVIVQDCDTADYGNLAADIGVVTTTNYFKMNMPGYERLMNAGLNVVCHSIEAYDPYGSNPEYAARIDVLAKKNGVTFTGSGIWDMSRIWSGILLTGPCTEIKSLYHRSLTDSTRIGRAGMMTTGPGFTAEQYRAQVPGNSDVYTIYRTVPRQVLTAIGYNVIDQQVRVEPVIFDKPIDCPLLDRVIEPGISVGTRMVSEYFTKEGVTLQMEAEWRLMWPDETEYMYWAVDGKPSTRIRIERDDSAHATIACLFNRIPDVIAAPPGIVLLSQLGPMKHTALQHASRAGDDA